MTCRCGTPGCPFDRLSVIYHAAVVTGHSLYKLVGRATLDMARGQKALEASRG